MNKALYIILFILSLGCYAQASNYTGTIQAGELEASVINPGTTTELILSGTMDVRDFAFIADSLRNLTLLDLSDCTVSEWESRDSYLGKGTRFESRAIPAYAFLGMDKLSTIKLPANAIKIGDGAFAGCPQLTSIEWGEQLQEIGAYAFAGDSLLNTSFPATLATIGEYAFEKCVAFTAIDLSQTGTQSIGNHAFANCTSATAISLPTTLKSLGNNTFAGCTALTEITLPASITQMGNSCFAHCTNLVSAHLGECSQLTTLPSYTFDHCTQLTTLALPMSIAEVGEGAFYYCQSLTTCTLPETTRHIDDYAFAKTAFAELHFLPEGVEEIGRWLFYGLDSLQTALLPSTLTRIGDHAFDHCMAMSTLYCEAAIPPTLGENVFQDVPQDSCQLFVPEESIALYKSAEQWCEFDIFEPNSIAEIANGEEVKAFFVGNDLMIQSTVLLRHIALYTADGRLAHNYSGTTAHHCIDTQAYSGGIFILSVQKESGEYIHLKLGRTH